eukprot:TRINITY_DN63734_c0_g1_i1.p1 TRINITY_DN63734_c0_g1~~TRINITY_DN63734_c0_g1_i1.p1  ORF type:complete len:562 (-),score=91.02 TRINITY_DN63734_c0_g1_i1:42-1655(-)
MAAEAEGNSAATMSLGELESFGSCARCVLRSQGCREKSRYVEIATPSEKRDACGLCLGLLEDGPAVRDAWTILRADLKAASSEGESYSLDVVLPDVCSFRHHLLCLSLQSASKATTDDAADVGGPATTSEGATSPVNVEEVLRWLLESDLESLRLRLVGDSSNASTKDVPTLRVTVSCKFSGDEAATLECALERHRSSIQGDGGVQGASESEPPLEKRRKLDNGSAAVALKATASETLRELLSSVRNAEECAALLRNDGGDSEATAIRKHLGRVARGADVESAVARTSLFISGRYTKLSRRLSQSPWIIDGTRMGDGSVEEHITGPAARFLSASVSACKFHAEGREDMDVRMLGAGRPFVIEVRESTAIKAAAFTGGLEAAIKDASSGLVTVTGLERCLPSAMAALQRDAEEHRKTYVCVCWSRRALSADDIAKLDKVKDLELQQKSPLRVAHRRGQNIRPRTVYWLRGELLNPHYFILRLSAQAGTYIKEFVHGDLGRTRPSVGNLLGDTAAEILQLDVEGLEESGASAGSAGAAA